MSRRYLIIVSTVAHVALGITIFATGVWKLEKLDYQHRASLTIGAMMPGDTGGGEGEKAPENRPEKKQDKKPRKVVKDTQPAKIREDEKAVPEVALSTGGNGEGDGEGDDVGPGKGGGGGGCDPLTSPLGCDSTGQKKQTASCGNFVVEDGEECDGGDKCTATCKRLVEETKVVAPNVLTALRISGDTQIVPPDPVKTEMLRSGKQTTSGSFKICIDTSGRISQVAPIAGATGYAAYDTKLATAIRSWRYRPYLLDGKTAVPACSVVTFRYTIN